MAEPTITMSLSSYENMKKEAERNHVKNFAAKVYQNVERNKSKLVVDYDALKRHLGIREGKTDEKDDC